MRNGNGVEKLTTIKVGIKK